MSRNYDMLNLTDLNESPVTVRLFRVGSKSAAIAMEASVNGVTASLSMTLGNDAIDALWDELTHLRSLRGL